MGVTTDFHWSYTDEPHATRRKIILEKYPQIKELYGYDPNSKYVAVLSCLIQFASAYLIRNQSIWVVAFFAWAVGGFVAHSLFLALHEVSHNLLFEKTLHNRLFGCIINTATAIPHFSMFQRYHLEHHQYQGVDGLDVDIPTTWEAKIINSRPFKAFFVLVMPLAYAVRPLVMKPKKAGQWEMVNWACAAVVDVLVWYSFGGKALAYLTLSGVLGSGLHPMAGHFIAEHYVFVEGHETYSYYGPLNYLTYNVGYHNEHHDFPRIPGSRLPLLKKIAPEYYNDLPHHTSWVKVMYDFVMDDRITLYSRVKRESNKLTRNLNEKKAD